MSLMTISRHILRIATTSVALASLTAAVVWAGSSPDAGPHASAATAGYDLPASFDAYGGGQVDADDIAPYIEPLAPEDATYASNEDLSVSEVVERTAEVGASYDLGDPLSLEDLEFIRIYAVAAGDAQLAGADSVDGEILLAAYTEPSSAEKALETTSGTFTNSTTKAGSTVYISGGAYSLTIGDTITNKWSASWTAKKTTGINVTKIKSQIDVYGYGAVAAWPFVGLVYETHPSGSTTTSQSYFFSRKADFTAFLVYATIGGGSTFTNANGSFQLTGK